MDLQAFISGLGVGIGVGFGLAKGIDFIVAMMRKS
jgi:hypothetical protein